MRERRRRDGECEIREPVSQARVEGDPAPEGYPLGRRGALVERDAADDLASGRDERRDPRIRRTHHRDPVLDGSERIHGEMLPWAARTTKPGVVRDVHDQARSTFHEFADELGKDSLVTDHDPERGWRAREDARAGARLELGDELGPAPDESDQSR